jgi:hypothetical protein
MLYPLSYGAFPMRRSPSYRNRARRQSRKLARAVVT